MSYLKAISQWLLATLEPWGAPGLMLIAICDSSFLSLPEVNDLALMGLSINNPLRMWEYAAMTVIGSVIGCTLLYTIGRKGGEAMLRKRFTGDKVDRVRGWYQKYGMLAIIVPSLLPPPLPFKIFVLSAGAFQMPWLKFMTAVGIGRSVRYFTEGILAVLYGQQAIQIVAENAPIVGTVLGVLIVAAAVVYAVMRRKRAGAAMILLPLVMILATGCFGKETRVPPAIKPLPFTRQQALDRLESMGRSIQDLKASIDLKGSILSQPDLQKTSPTLSAALLLERPDRFLLKGGVAPITIFEMVSDGTKYQFYNTQKKELYVDGMEEGPPYKPFAHLGTGFATKFVNLRPRLIGQALVPDVRDLLQNPSITIATYRYPVELRTYYCVDFFDEAAAKELLLVQRFWFDLSTKEIDLVRRQTFMRNGELETDTTYGVHVSLPAGIRFPSKVAIHFAAADTTLDLELKPEEAVFNAGIPPDTFQFNSHPDAKIYKFVPDETPSITQQR